MEKVLENGQNPDTAAMEPMRAASPPDFDKVTWMPDEEKSLLRRIDLRVLPGLAVLYLLCFLDRTNIGNAKLQGLLVDLHMVGNDYNLALCLFFITYILFEVPSNLVLRRVRPSLYFPAIMLGWGIVMTLMGIVKSLTGLVVARIFLGLMEAGYFPGVAFYLSMWYKRSEHAFRIAIFFSMATVAGAFGGIFAYGIAHMRNVGGYENGWHWIFILGSIISVLANNKEGLLTVLVSVIAPFFIRDYPNTTKFLRPRERDIALARLVKDAPIEEKGFEIRYVWEALKDPKLYVMIVIYLGTNCSLYAISFFLPSIIQGLGFTAATAQILTAPPYACAFITVLASAYISDRFKRRGYVNAFNFMVAIIGFIVLETTTTPGARYVGTFFACMGAFPCIAVTIAWNANNIKGSPTQRAVGIALQSSVGSFGGVIGSYIYVAGDAPKYRKGHAVMIALNSLSFVLTWIMIFWLKYENRKLDRQEAAEKASRGDTSANGDIEEKPERFRYIL